MSLDIRVILRGISNSSEADGKAPICTQIYCKRGQNQALKPLTARTEISSFLDKNDKA